MLHVWDRIELNRFLVVKPEWKRRLERLRLRCEEVIETVVIELQ